MAESSTKTTLSLLVNKALQILKTILYLYLSKFFKHLANGELHDYSSSFVIPLCRGNVSIKGGHFYLIHTINLTRYDELFEESQNMLKNFDEKLKAYPLLKHDTNEIEKLLKIFHTLHVRQKRSLNFLGSIWKFIGGSPDHDDLVLLQNREEALTQNQNDQVNINEKIQEHINSLTDKINQIIRTENKIIRENSENESILELLIIRNRIIISDLTNILNGIAFSKMNIINPLILNIEEINKIIQIDNILPIADLLMVTKVKIYSSDNEIKYFLKIPKVKQLCKYVELYPVIKNNNIISIETNTMAKCDDSYIPITNCEKAINTLLCEIMGNAKCSIALMNNNKASCSTETAKQISKIHTIDDGVINDASAQVTEENKSPVLVPKGTYVIKFNSKVLINNTSYETSKKAITEPISPKLVLLNFTSHNEIITLDYVHKLHINNTKRLLLLLKEANMTSNITWLAVAVLSIMVITIVLVFIMKNSTRLIINNKSTETQPSPVEASQIATIRALENIVRAGDCST